jgi:hypothetical protein
MLSVCTMKRDVALQCVAGLLVCVVGVVGVGCCTYLVSKDARHNNTNVANKQVYDTKMAQQ